MNKTKTLYELSSELALEVSNVFHFTNFDVLNIILKTKKLRLSNMQNLNDKNEIKYLDRIWMNKVFIISFTNKIDSHFWNNYTSGNDGICIEFEYLFKQKYNVCNSKNINYMFCDKTNFNYTSFILDEDWGIRSLDYLKVFYVNDPEQYREYDHSFINFFSSLLDKEKLNKAGSYIIGQGFIKEKTWEIEEEYRIRVAMRPKGIETKLSNNSVEPIYYDPPFDYVFIDIHEYDISNMTIWIKKDFEKKEELMKLKTIYKFKLKESY